METPEEFAAKWRRREQAWWVKCFRIFILFFILAGAGLAIGQFYDQPAQLIVPFLLTGIACCLVVLVAYVEGIMVDLEYLQHIERSRIDDSNQP